MEKVMVVFHQKGYKTGYDEVIIDVDSIKCVRTDSTGTIIKFSCGSDYININVKESVAEVADLLVAVNVTISNYELGVNNKYGNLE